MGQEWKPKRVTIPKPNNDDQQQQTVTLQLHCKTTSQKEKQRKERAKQLNNGIRTNKCSQDFKTKLQPLSSLSSERSGLRHLALGFYRRV